MVSFYGDYDLTETVIIPFNTFSSDDPSASVTITNLASGDIKIHKDGSTTERDNDIGVTVTINFDSITGNHIVSIDVSDGTDPGFYANGSRYQVRMEGTTVDGATINAWIGAFSIGCTLRPTTDGRKLDVTTTGEAGLDFDNTSGTIDAAQLGGDCITAAKIADDAISSEHLNTGALTADAFAADALVAATFATGAFTADAFAANALVGATFAASSLDGKGDWNTVTPDAAGVAPTAAEIKTEVEQGGSSLAQILADTGELQTDDIPGTLSTIAGYLDTEIASIQSRLGVPTPFDSGTNTIAGMLIKMADDNAGADFDAETDSLNKIAAGAAGGGATAQQVWEYAAGGGRILTAGTNIGTVAANITQIEGHALAGTGTRLADGFEYWFNVATPTKTMNDAGVAGSGLTAAQVWAYGIPASPSANTAADYLQMIDAVVGGVTNTDTANEVAFKNRSGTEVRRITFGTADGSRTASVIS